MAPHCIGGLIGFSVPEGGHDVSVRGHHAVVPFFASLICPGIVVESFFQTAQNGAVDGVAGGVGDGQVKPDVCRGGGRGVASGPHHDEVLGLNFSQVGFAGLVRGQSCTFRFQKDAEIDKLEEGLLGREDRLGF